MGGAGDVEEKVDGLFRFEYWITSMIEQHPHGLPREEALSRLRLLGEYWRTRYNVRTVWSGYRGEVSGRVFGIRFSGTVTVEPDLLIGELRAGFLGEKLGGRGYVKRKLAEYLDPRVPLESLEARCSDGQDRSPAMKPIASAF
jgi:hypothetical protein